jgi:hypothetical protein
MKKVWIISVETESGDKGLSGYFLNKPTKAGVDTYLKKWWPDDFESGTAYATVEELALEKSN